MSDEQPRDPKDFEPYVGTDRLARALTDEERDRFAELLEAHDFEGAYLIALRFAYAKTHRMQSAKDLMSRVKLRLVRTGWDPKEVPLAKRLCRLVYSEWTHEIRESDVARRAEEVFLRMLEMTEGIHVRSVEEEGQKHATEHAEDLRDFARLDALRGSFLAAGDAVNLIWLEFTLRGVDDVAEMAAKSGRDLKEFYRAADRRKRHMRRLLAAESGEGSEES